MSYCFAVKVVGEIGLPNPTEQENNDGFKPEWHTIENAIKLMETAKPDSKSGARMMNRDLTFIKEFVRLL